MPPKKRQSISIDQKLAVRSFKETNPKLTYKDITEWFKDKYKQQIAVSSVSDILSKRYENLLTDNANKQRTKRRRQEAWPELEKALRDWLSLMPEEVAITGEVLKAKAKWFFEQIPACQGQPMPKFSNGWYSRFLDRHNIKTLIRTGDKDTEFKVVDSSNKMTEVHQTLKEFALKDRFNCDETMLYWKRLPDQRPRKVSKERITVTLCCNADGSERLPIWFIGTEKSPACLRSFNNIDAWPEIAMMKWRYNSKANLTSAIFEEYLRWFDDLMEGRKVALLLDTYSSHVLAWKSVQTSFKPFRNVTVVWLPAADRFQPLEQGVTQAWKTHWKIKWLNYILEEYEVGKEAVKTMQVYNAMKWGVASWEHDITKETIESCFAKACCGEILDLFHLTSIQEQNAQIGTGVDVVLMKNLQWLQNLAIVQLGMDAHSFVNPADEIVQDVYGGIDDLILSQFYKENEEPVPEEDVEGPKTSSLRVLQSCMNIIEDNEMIVGELDPRFLSVFREYQSILYQRKNRRTRQNEA